MIVRIVDIGGIDDHHCLNFLFIMQGRTKYVPGNFFQQMAMISLWEFIA